MCELSKILKDLDNNVMFRISLENNELFHSNFLAWIFETYPEQCSNIFKIDLPKCTDKNNYIKREKNIGKNTEGKKCIADIYIKKDNNEIIIENKFKSYPYKEQLDDYTKLNKNCKIILMSYFEPSFDITEYTFWSYEYIKENLIKLIEKIKDTDNKIFIKKYIEMLSSLLNLKDLISLKKNKKTYEENYSQIKKIEELANKINCYKFIQKIAYFQLANDIRKDIKGIDWVHVDVSQNQKIYIDMMVDCKNEEYKKLGIKSLGITFSENERTARHHMGIEAIGKETREMIENELITETKERYKLLEWFFSNCKGKGTDKKYFYGFDCIKDQGCCWLFKKTDFYFTNLDFESIKNYTEKEITEIINKTQ